MQPGRQRRGKRSIVRRAGGGRSSRCGVYKRGGAGRPALGNPRGPQRPGSHGEPFRPNPLSRPRTAQPDLRRHPGPQILPTVLIAEEVRRNSAEYPRPLPLDLFEAPPFELTPVQIESALKEMASHLDFCDITYTRRPPERYISFPPATWKDRSRNFSPNGPNRTFHSIPDGDCYKKRSRYLQPKRPGCRYREYSDTKMHSELV